MRWAKRRGILSSSDKSAVEKEIANVSGNVNLASWGGLLIIIVSCTDRRFRFETSQTFENEQNLVTKIKKCANFGAKTSQMRKFGRRIHVNIDFC